MYNFVTTGAGTQRESGTADQQQTREGTGDQHGEQRADTQSSRAAEQAGGEKRGELMSVQQTHTHETHC